MKYLILTLSAFLLPGVTLAQSSAEKPPSVIQATTKITLKNAIDLAVQHSYNLKAAQSSLRSAEYNESAAFRSIGPGITASGTNMWSNGDSSSGLFSTSRQNLTSNATFSASQPILGIIPLFHNMKKADISIEIAKQLSNSSQNQAALLGAKVYLNLQLALAQLDIANASLTTIQKSKEDAETSFQAGSINKDDYLRILLQYTQAQQGVVTAQSNLTVAKFALAQALGLNNMEQMDVSYDPVSYWESNKLSLPDLEEAKTLSLKQNPDLKIADENVKLAEINKTISEDNYLPSVNVVADYQRNFNTNSLQTNKNNVDFGLKLTWNVWDWGVRSAQNDSLTEQIFNQKYNAEDQRETLLNNVVNQYYEIVNNENGLKTAKTALQTSDEAFQLVSFRFLNGQVSALELVTAQQNLTTSKASLAQARFNLDLAWITFQTYLGKSPTL